MNGSQSNLSEAFGHRTPSGVHDPVIRQSYKHVTPTE